MRLWLFDRVLSCRRTLEGVTATDDCAEESKTRSDVAELDEARKVGDADVGFLAERRVVSKKAEKDDGDSWS